MREKCEVLALLAAPAWRRGGSTNTFREEWVKKMSRNCLAFQICCSQSIRNNSQKNRFQKTKTKTKKICSELLSKMTGRKWSDIAQYPKWPLCGHRDVNSQWAYSRTLRRVALPR